MPIFRSARLYVTAYGCQHLMCWLVSCETGKQAVLTVHGAHGLLPFFTRHCAQCTRPASRLHKTVHSAHGLLPGFTRHCARCTRPASLLHKTLCTVHTACFPASQDTVHSAHGLLPCFTRHCAQCTRPASRIPKTSASTSSAENRIQ